jgi:transposase
MANCSKVSGKVTIGLDLGDTYSYLYALDAAGQLLEEGRLRTTAEALRERFGAKAPARVAMETGTHSPWVSRLLEDLGHEVLVANSRQLRLISESDKKTDRADAKTLAELAYTRPQLLRPIQPRPLEAQVGLARIRARQSLVEARTKLVNHVRGAVKSMGARLPSCSTRSFHDSAPEHIPEALKAILAPHLKVIKELSAEIASHDKAVEKLCEKKYPETEVLMQVPGVGCLTAAALVLVLVNPRRFKDSRAVGAYLGLTPRKSDSGKQEPQLRITKAGDGLMRRLLVGSAHYILGPFGPDTDLRRYGLELGRRGGKNAKKRAVVAVARKLAVLLHRLWLTGEVYEPLRKAARRERRKGGAVGAGSVESK